jgi:hypothetical protein
MIFGRTCWRGLDGGQVGPPVPPGRIRGAESVKIPPYTAISAVLEGAPRKTHSPKCVEVLFSEVRL